MMKHADVDAKTLVQLLDHLSRLDGRGPGVEDCPPPECKVQNGSSPIEGARRGEGEVVEARRAGDALRERARKAIGRRRRRE